MKLNSSGKGIQAMTLFEVFIIVAILMFMAVLLLPILARPRDGRGSQRISCVNNIKQVGLAYRVWASDNNDQYPPMVSVTNGGTMELVAADPNFIRDTFLVMSNELSTPKVLHCPSDDQNKQINSFSPAFTNTNISYFIGVDATDTEPQMILSGDDNLSISNLAVKSGILTQPTNTPVAWTKERHRFAGNIGLADGSAQQVTISGLQSAVVQTGFATNRFAIP